MELLAPAGNWEAFLAGINNGADAVYIGGKSFSARQNAPNFTGEEIKKALDYAHLKNKKVYITANTLIGAAEFDYALDYIYDLYALDVDAVIVQDLGLMAAIKSLIPNLTIHASTQMTIHNELGVQFLQSQGVTRVVLAREMSLKELAIIRQVAPNIELEVFAHGAICYSYSGQCLFSSLIGGRSGNRGRCAGPCRLPYNLYGKTGKYDNSQGDYLLSPADLCLINYIADLETAGINSLKIEGRMKRPEYVAIVTKAYREAIDKIGSKDSLFSNNKDLLKVFNRSFTTGYLIPGNKAPFLNPQRPNNQGDYNDIELLNKAAATMVENTDKIEVRISLILEKDQPLKLIMDDYQEHQVVIYGNEITSKALNRPLTLEDAKGKVMRLGETTFILKDFYFSNLDDLLVSFSEINEARRRASQALLDSILSKNTNQDKALRESYLELKPQFFDITSANRENNNTKLSIITSNLKGAQTAIEAGADIVYISLESIGVREKIKLDELRRIMTLAQSKGVDLIPALPRIQKPQEFNLGKDLLNLGGERIMVGNLGALNWALGNNFKVSADYTLNIFNPYTLKFMVDQGVEAGTLSPELSLKQVGHFPDLSQAELIVHGELILMTSEYCMLSGILGNGTSYCKEKFCQQDNYYIKDDKGYAFPIETDRNCRFYLFNSRTLSMIENLDKMLKLKPYALRIEAHRLDDKQIAKTIAIYKNALKELKLNIHPDLLNYKLELEKINNSPFTKGHYYRGVL